MSTREEDPFLAGCLIVLGILAVLLALAGLACSAPRSRWDSGPCVAREVIEAQAVTVRCADGRSVTL